MDRQWHVLPRGPNSHPETRSCKMLQTRAVHLAIQWALAAGHGQVGARRQAMLDMACSLWSILKLVTQRSRRHRALKPLLLDTEAGLCPGPSRQICEWDGAHSRVRRSQLDSDLSRIRTRRHTLPLFDLQIVGFLSLVQRVFVFGRQRRSSKLTGGCMSSASNRLAAHGMWPDGKRETARHGYQGNLVI